MLRPINPTIRLDSSCHSFGKVCVIISRREGICTRHLGVCFKFMMFLVVLLSSVKCLPWKLNCT
jgi:hypothetical protein